MIFLSAHPYQNLTFLAFLAQLFQRFYALVTGKMSFNQLVSDEIQVLVLIGVAVSCALIGVFLVLRRMTMIANSLSHTILLGIVFAYVLSPKHSEQMGFQGTVPMQAMLIAALIMGFITTFLTNFLNKVGQLQEDASIGLIFTSLFACGIIAVTLLTRNSHIGLEAVMGNADALNHEDFYWVYWVAIFNILICWLFFKEYNLTTFDPSLAAAFGFSPFLFNHLLMIQVSATSIVSFRAVGVLLVLAFLTAPYLAARLLTERLIPLIFCALFIGTISVIIGVGLTRHLLSVYGVALSTGGVVVSTLTTLYICCICFHTIRKYFQSTY